jgi:hypothetical protein
MRTLLLISLLGMCVSQGQTSVVVQEGSSIEVVEFNWTKSRRTIESTDPSAIVPPASAVLPLNKNFDRNIRSNRPPGARDPNADTTDGRAAALEQTVQESRGGAKPKPVDGFAYRVKLKNSSTKIIEIIYFEYQFTDPSDPANGARRQFLCGAIVKPGKQKELRAFSALGPSIVTSVASLSNKSANPIKEGILINRIEYADGSIWQRKDWKFGEIRLGIERALATPWGFEMCRSL